MATTAATPTTTAAPAGTTARRVGTTLLVLVSAFLLFDAVTHIANIQIVEEAMADLGYPAWTATFIGVLELIGVVLYVVPRTGVLGAVWLTAYLGGAFASQVRIEAPVFSTLLFPVYVGLALWAGLYLRTPELRRVLPVREG